MKKYVVYLFVLFALSSYAFDPDGPVMRVDSNGNVIEQATRIPTRFRSVVNYHRADIEMWLADGWLRVVEWPHCPEGYIVDNADWTSDEFGIATWTWDCIPAPEEPVEVPQEVTRRQFRIALVLAGIDLDDITATLNSIEDETERAIALIEWQDALTFKRDHPLIISFAPLFNLSEEDLDNLFISAATFD